MWGTGSIVFSSITASMLRLVASFFLCFGALHFPSRNSLKTLEKGTLSNLKKVLFLI